MFSIPATGTPMAAAFYFKTEIALVALSRCPLHSGRHKNAHQSPQKSGQTGQQTLSFFTYMGLSLTRTLECSLGNIKYPYSVLSGPLSQTIYLGGWWWRAGGFILVICSSLKKKSHPVDSSRGSQSNLYHKLFFLITWEENLA